MNQHHDSTPHPCLATHRSQTFHCHVECERTFSADPAADCCALQRISANAQTRGQVKFGQIFLAAPDVDRDLFLNLAQLYPDHSERTTLYASNGDLPVHLSSKLHDSPRAGYYTPYTVAVPDFDLDLLGHSYFAQAQALLQHMRDLILNGQATVTGNQLHPAVDGGMGFWKLKR